MSSAPEPSRTDRLISQLLLQDGSLRDVVEEFVRGLDGRLEELRLAHERMDFDRLTVLAHQLKGAAGSYGYPDISRLCAEMELKFRSHQADNFHVCLEQLAGLVQAAREGLAEP